MISGDYYSKLAKVESGDNPLAKNPKSSAKGRYQFIDSTAKEYGINAPFGTPEYERQENEAVKKFTAANYEFLKEKIGREPTQGELYLAHQQGAQGAVNLLTQPDKKAVEVVGKDAIVNNGGNEEMTVAEFAAKWTGKFDENKEIMNEAGAGNITDKQTVPLPKINLYNLVDYETGNVKAVEKPAAAGKSINLYDIIKTPQANDDEFIQKDTLSGVQKERIDSKSGAPSFVRAMVGSVYDQKDRLSTLQKHFPDAQPYGDDNFIFTNPETNRPTLYNPKGLDRGDIASISREAVVTTGSGIGAAVGAMTGLGTAGTTSIPAAMAGAAQGAAVVGTAYDKLLNKLGMTVDTRSYMQKALDVAAEGALAAAGEGAGRVIAPLAKRALGGASKTAQDVMQSFKSFGIRPSLPAATGGRGVAILEAGLAQTPSSAGIIEKQTGEIIEQTQKAVSKITQKYGKPGSIQETGEVIKQASIKAADRIGFRQESLYQEAYDAMGAGAKVDVASVKALYQDMMSEVSRAPGSLAPKLKPALNELGAIIADAGDEGIDFQALRQVRTAIGKDLSKSFMTSGSEDAARKRIYGAISEDLAEAASQASPKAAGLIKKADRYTRMYETQYKKYIAKIIDTDAEEKAYRYAMSSAQYGGTTLKKLKNLFTTEEWDMVSASVFDRLGDASAGMQNATGDAFSINTFLTNWNRLSPEAKDVLFNSKGHKETYRSIEKLTGLMSKLKEAGRSENTSRTAGALATMTMMQGLGGGIIGMTQGGDTTSVLSYAAGGILAPRVAAKLITNPKFIEWLAAPVEQGISSIPAHISKLIAIGELDETMKEPIRDYLGALDSATKKEEE